MSEAWMRPEPSLIPIEQPRCPKCQGGTMLSRIEPGANGSDCGPSNVLSASTSVSYWLRTDEVGQAAMAGVINKWWCAACGRQWETAADLSKPSRRMLECQT
jgi:hypothetical protein